MCCQNVSLFFKLFVHLTILKKSYFPIINTSMAILEMKTVLRYVLFSFSKRSVFTFLIMKPKTKLSFSFSNIGSIITNFVCQNIKNIFWVRVKGTTLNFKYFPTCFCYKSFCCDYMITHLTSTIPNMVQSLQHCPSLATLLSLRSP